MYLIPFLFIQICSTSLVASVMTVEDYGMYTLYLTTINFLYLMTVGVIDGYTIENRSKKKSEIGGIQKLLASYIFMITIFGIVGILILYTFGFETIYYYSLIAAIFTAIYHLTQTIFRTLNEAHKQNIYVLFMRLAFLLDGFIYMMTLNLKETLIFDIVFRVLIVLIAIVHVLFEYRKNCQYGDGIVKYIKIGFVVTVSNTIFNITLMADKFALSDDLESLGIYSLAITVVLMTRIIIAPLNQVLFVTIDEKTDSERLVRNILLIIGTSFILLLPSLYVGKILILNISFLGKYESAIPIIAISMLIIPLMIPVESIIVNINKIRNGRLFLIKSILIAIIFVVVLFTYVNSTAFNLQHYTMLVVSLYFISFLIYSGSILKKKQILYCSTFYLILSYIYIHLANYLI